jgi:hypothetical protein
MTLPFLGAEALLVAVQLFHWRQRRADLAQKALPPVCRLAAVLTAGVFLLNCTVLGGTWAFFQWLVRSLGPQQGITLSILAVGLLPGLTLLVLNRIPLLQGRCPTCGYDLTGNVSGRCPECGRRFDASGTAATSQEPENL